ncbi:MAG: alpha/beta hydrolase family protein [Chloroflexota bacterium]
MTENQARYQTHSYLRNRWEQTGRQLAFTATTLAEQTQWRLKLIPLLRQLTGYDTMIPVEPEPNITEEIHLDGYIRQRVEIQTEPGVIMPLYVLIPASGQAPYPVIIAPHGHGSGGKFSVAGCRDLPQVSEAIDIYNYDYGVKFAQAGFITFCPDARGFGERQEDAAKESILNSSCLPLNNMAFPLGQTVTGMWTWDIHRLIDYVETREDCNADRIGCAGLSGGGLQTLWATALDERIRCAIISGYMYGYKESLLDLHQNCSCNYVPHLYEYVDMGDIAALIAPRPLMVESGDQDPLNGASGLANVESQIEIIRRAYRLLDVENKVRYEVFEGEHMWGGAEAIPWMMTHLGD